MLRTLCLLLIAIAGAAGARAAGPIDPVATTGGGPAASIVAGSSLGFLFGAFCALWAQNTRRNPWLWFVAGVLFNVVTVVVLLVLNSRDRKSPPPAPLTERFGGSRAKR